MAAMSNSNVLHRDAIAEHNTDRCYVSKSPGMEQFPDVKPHAVVSATMLPANQPVMSLYVHVCEKIRGICRQRIFQTRLMSPAWMM